MKALNRFLILFLILLFFLILRFHLPNVDQSEDAKPETDFYSSADISRPTQTRERRASGDQPCAMSTCFDFSRCASVATHGLSVHIYGMEEHVSSLSEGFKKVLEIIEKSVYFEPNPQKACLFIAAAFDPMDRDPLSRDFQKPSPRLQTFEPLFGGVNHVVFNLYTGTWPDYREMDFGLENSFGGLKRLLRTAILVKASQSRDHYRNHFDVSLPLFARSHVTRGPEFSAHEQTGGSLSREKRLLSELESRERRKRLLVFKGKRYIYGIGSETRNSLHFLNNEKDILILTTCRHGKKWKEWKDDKCDHDDTHYQSHDYQELMANATFCLIPRGRRLGSYRFLEALHFGCIPVLLSNAWVLPFHEIIDWHACAVLADERLVLQIPEVLRSFPALKIAEMRHKCLLLFDRFFSSVEKIVFTSLLIIKDRITPQMALHDHVFQEATPRADALVTRLQMGLPAPHSLEPLPPGVTCVIHVVSALHVPEVERVLSTVGKSRFVKEVVLLWRTNSSLIPKSAIRSPKTRILVNAENRFAVSIATEAVLHLSPQSLISAEEIAFAFGVWSALKNRIIGFDARDHFWDEEKRHLEYSSKWTNRYSSVTLDAALFRSEFAHWFAEWWERSHALDRSDECLDLAFAFFVSHVTREGAVKVSQRKRSCARVATLEEFSREQKCFSALLDRFKYLPLIRSQLRFDPLLFKDAVSVRRKKFRKMEL